jgi:hypothetical protein
MAITGKTTDLTGFLTKMGANPKTEDSSANFTRE